MSTCHCPSDWQETRSFGVLDQKEIRSFNYMSQCAESEVATVTMSEKFGRLQGAGARDFVLQLIRRESFGGKLQES